MQASTGSANKSPQIVGLLSDSHGESSRTREAVKLLDGLGATAMIHLGDFETLDCLDPLAGLNSHLVWGNCDVPDRLEDYARSIGIRVHGTRGELVIDGATLRFAHDPSEAIGWIPRGSWFVHGHTHVPKGAGEGGPRIICPGALHRPRTQSGVCTVATICPATGHVAFHDLL